MKGIVFSPLLSKLSARPGFSIGKSFKNKINPLHNIDSVLEL